MSPLRIVVVQADRISLTESFIRNQIRNLNTVVGTVELQGQQMYWNGEPQRPPGLPMRVVNKVVAALPGNDHWKVFQRRLVPRVAAARPDVVLAQYGPSGVRFADACKKVGVPLVVHFHGYDAFELSLLERNRQGYQQLWQDAAHVIVVSRAMRKQILQLGCPAAKVSLNPYGVNVPSDPVQSLREPDSRVLIAVGRFVAKKAPHLTLLAFSEALKAFSDARLVMIGDGPLLGPCKDMAKALRIDHAVEFRGPQPHEEVLREMGMASAFVQHSVVAESGDCEGTPVAILEACAAGLPVIATRHSGICDVIEQNVSGILVDERDVEAMSGAMREVLGNPARAAEMGRQAQAFVRAGLSMEQSIQRLQGLLERVVNGSIEEDAAKLTREIEKVLVPA